VNSIREIFHTRRPIDRPIEKVIDYAAIDDIRLRAEIDEYEVTDHIENSFRRFFELYSDGVQGRGSGDCGVWVSGFYGSGKSSFTKYLGLALDDDCIVDGRPFWELLGERLQSQQSRALLSSLINQYPTAVVMLDLATEQMSADAAAPVTNVLYYKVLQKFGYSREKKLCRLELELDSRGLRRQFEDLYREKFGSPWADIHNDEMIGVANAAQIVPRVLPMEFPTPESFSELVSEKVETVQDLGLKTIEIVRQKSGKQNILFLIDEAGQYVAPRSELILNLDGLARTLKESGGGHVWLVCTGQQTLTEISEQAALNSAELGKLRDRFPISLELEAQDIEEITYRRLLSKSDAGDQELRAKFSAHGQALIAHTRISGSRLFKGDPDADEFVRLYPFLPVHFDLVLELIRSMARVTGGIGLRSAIRVIQDVLVDTSGYLPQGAVPVADRPVGSLACADDIYNTLRMDIEKSARHVVEGVQRVAKAFPGDELKLRVAKTVAVLQTLDDFPKTPENIAAMLYRELGAASLLDDVRAALSEICAATECGLVEDPRAGGFVFLSDSVRPLIEKRNAYVPTGNELARLRNEVVRAIFESAPSVRIQNVKDVKACLRVGNVFVAGDEAGVEFRLELVEPTAVSARRDALQVETNSTAQLKNRVVWLAAVPEDLEDHLVRAARSQWAARLEDEMQADKEIAQFIRGERRAAGSAKDDARRSLEAALFEGSFFFRGVSRAAAEAGKGPVEALRAELQLAAGKIYEHLSLVPIRPSTDLAAKFLEITDLSRMPRDRDPLELVVTKGGNPKVNMDHPALAETLRAFDKRMEEAGGAGRLYGNVLQDMFLAPPYGWTKDATRYLFAALLAAKEVEFHSAEGPIRSPGPKAVDAAKSAQAFAKTGVSRSQGGPSQEALVSAAKRLAVITGESVLPLEDSIANAVKSGIAPLATGLAGLPVRLSALDLPGADRARDVLDALVRLVQSDETGAVAILADDQSTLVADVKWVRDLDRALSDSAIEDLKSARGLLSQLEALRMMFPLQVDQGIGPGLIDGLRDDLISSAFFERLGTIRSAVGQLRKRAQEMYADRYRDFVERSQTALARVQAQPGWALLDPGDQLEFVEQLSVDKLPPAPSEGNEARDLQMLLVADNGVASMEATIASKLPQVTVASGDSVEVVRAATLAPDGLLEDDDDVEAWLQKLRLRFSAVIKDGKSIRIIGG